MSNPDDMIHLPMQSPRFSRLLSTIDDVVRQHYGDEARVLVTFIRENGVTRLKSAHTSPPLGEFVVDGAVQMESRSPAPFNPGTAVDPFEAEPAMGIIPGRLVEDDDVGTDEAE